MNKTVRDIRRELDRVGLTAELSTNASGHCVATLADGRAVVLGSLHGMKSHGWENAVATIKRVAREGRIR